MFLTSYVSSWQSFNRYCSPKLRGRVCLASSVTASLQLMWKDQCLSVATKIHVYQSLVLLPCTVTDGETWTLLDTSSSRMRVMNHNWSATKQTFNFRMARYSLFVLKVPLSSLGRWPRRRAGRPRNRCLEQVQADYGITTGWQDHGTGVTQRPSLATRSSTNQSISGICKAPLTELDSGAGRSRLQ